MLSNFTKRGQVSDTMTWIVATLLIILILVFFVYISFTLAKAKSIERVVFRFGGVTQDADWIQQKTVFAFGVNSANREAIQEWVDEPTS